MSVANLRPLRREVPRWIVLALLMVGFSGCGRSQPAPDPRIDDSLRIFLGVKSLSAKLQIPTGEDFFTFHVLNFEHGRLVDDAVCMPSKLASGSSREMSMELLWGQPKSSSITSDNVVTLFVSSHDSHGWSRQSGRTAEYWHMFDRSSAQTVNPEKPVEHLGYKILAYVQAGEGIDRVPTTNFEEAVLHQPYVGAIAIKTYSSQEAMDKDKILHASRNSRARY